MPSERLIDDLDNGQVVEVRLAPGEVYPRPDLARLANEQALRKNSSVYDRYTSGILPDYSDA
jgi:hypothetical protein